MFCDMERTHRAQLFRQKFDSNAYLDTFVNNRYESEEFLCSHLFKVFDQGKVKGVRCVDVGAGPVVHRLAYASRFFDQLVHTDFLDQNLELVHQWLTTVDLDPKHRHHMKLAARLEGHKDEEEGAKQIEARLRSKIVSVLPVDVLDVEPIKDLDEHGGPFDCALSFACIESACGTYEEFVQAAKNIGRILKPNGALVLTGYPNVDHYKIGDTTFPRLMWDLEMVQRGLRQAGYRLDSMDYNTKPTSFKPFFSLSYKN